MAVDSKFTAGSAATYYMTLTPESGANAGKVWNGTSYEAWNDSHVNNYGVLGVRQGTSLEYVFTLPSGCDQGVVHDVSIYAKAGGSYNPLAAGDVYAGGGQLGGPSVLGVVVQPIVSAVGNWQTNTNDLIAFQFAAFGPFTFTLTDQAGSPISVDGDSISFVVSDKLNTWVWQIDSCPVSGPSHNIVTVSQGNTNTGTAGDFKYVLRDRTSGQVLAYGPLLIVQAVNAH